MPDGTITTRTIAYQDGGLALEGLLTIPEGTVEPRPGVLLLPAAFGINAHPKDQAKRLAALGYVVLIADLFGGGASFGSLDEAMTHVGPLREDVATWRRRLDAALAALCAQPEVATDRIAAIGYCFGGTGALELAYSGAELRAVISLHGGLKLSDPAGATRVRGSVLVGTGADDPMVPDGDVNEFQRQMRASKADWQVHSYGNTRHAFTDPAADGFGNPATAYNPAADRRSWAATRQLLAECLGGDDAA